MHANVKRVCKRTQISWKTLLMKSMNCTRTLFTTELFARNSSKTFFNSIDQKRAISRGSILSSILQLTKLFPMKHKLIYFFQPEYVSLLFVKLVQKLCFIFNTNFAFNVLEFNLEKRSLQKCLTDYQLFKGCNVLSFMEMFTSHGIQRVAKKNLFISYELF